MSEESREFGPQPLDAVLAELGLTNHDLVNASTEHLTHKMVAKARRGRRVTNNVKGKIANALNASAPGGRAFRLAELFNYR